jgi:hypothetical protein
MKNSPNKYRWQPGRFQQKDEGEKLDETTRSSMESILGHDLRDVRIHQTAQAGDIARRLGAEAYTIGTRVFSEEGALTAPSRQSQGLLAHELTHVIQQTRPKPLAAGPGISTIKNPAPGRTGAPQMSSPVSAEPASTDTEEREAIRNETAVRNRGRPRRNSSPEIDPEQIADIVYRLMQTEIWIENDRMRR